MDGSIPGWFAADQLVQQKDGWYIGSADGFRVGPYPIRSEAARHSEDLAAKLSRCRSTGDQVRLVRTFLHEQSSRNRRQLHSGTTPAEPAADGEPDRPPVRAGEERRVWFRTSRFFAVDDVWFFSTRENIDVGPYVSRAEAERDAARLLTILADTHSLAEARLAIQQFKSRPQVG